MLFSSCQRSLISKISALGKSLLEKSTCSVIFVGLCLIMISLRVSGQMSVSGTHNFTVHSPTASNLGAFGEYPVSLATGVPKIGIPLYTIKSSKLELPIYIEYHASGVKVSQESGFVGLGWTLNAGGLVTRIIRDKRDENGNEGFLQIGGSLPEYNPITDETVTAGAFGFNSTLFDLKNKDKEPDLFSAVVSDFATEFILNNSGSFISTELDSVRYSVNFLNNAIVITNRDGNIYRFGRSLLNEEAFETTSNTYQTLVTGSTNFSQSNPNLGAYTSSWFLTEIISSDLTDTIFFKYKVNRFSSATGKMASWSRFSLNAGEVLNSTDEMGVDFVGDVRTFMNTSIHNMRSIGKIFFKGGSVEFSTANDRVDLYSQAGDPPANTRITGLSVFDRSHQLIQRIGFENNEYFNRPSGQLATYSAPLDYMKKSLKLSGIKFYGSDNQFENQYTFDYDPTNLPAMHSLSQDYWGYYNGKNNSTLVPSNIFTNAFNGQPIFVGQSRETDFNFMKAATLNKVVFPSGGYTQYEFEPNYYLTEQQGVGKTEQTVTKSISAINQSGTCPEGYFQGIPASNVIEFTIGEELVNSVGKLTVFISDYKNWSGSPMRFKLTDLSNGQIFEYTNQPSQNGQTKVVEQNITVYFGHNYRLEANTYGVTGSVASICNSPYIFGSLTYNIWVPATNVPLVPRQAGGLRVKQISNYDSNDLLVKKTSYEYGSSQSATSNIGTGILISDPSKTFYNFPLLYSQNNQASLKNVSWFTSNSQVELGLNNGCPVDYDKVTVKVIDYTGNNEGNGKSEYFFFGTGKDHIPYSGSKYPYNTWIFPRWKKSYLKKLVISKSLSDGSYMPIREISYNYTDVPQTRVKTLIIDDAGPEFGSGSKNSALNSWLYTQNSQQYYYFNFYVPCGKRIKSSEISIDFINGVAGPALMKEFAYNSFFDPNLIRFTNSRSDLIETRTKYTGDLDYQLLKSKFIVSLPAQEEILVNGKVKSGSIFRYTDFGAISEKYITDIKLDITPVNYVASSTVPSYYIKSEEYFYGTNNRLRETKLFGKPESVYLWSYAGQFPIVEIKNTTYTSVEALLGSSTISSYANRYLPAETDLASLTTSLRINLPLAKISSFVYKPIVGLRSQTDAKGMSTYYEYDNFQRLKSVKDQNGNIVKSYEYNYKP